MGAVVRGDVLEGGVDGLGTLRLQVVNDARPQLFPVLIATSALPYKRLSLF